MRVFLLVLHPLGLELDKTLFDWNSVTPLNLGDTCLSKIPIAPCYCRMIGQTLKEEIRITQCNNPTKAGKYSLEDLFRASDNIPLHYPKF